MSCDLNQAQSCADCIHDNGICRLFPPACGGPPPFSTFEMSQMQAQIDEVYKTLQEMQQEHVCEMVRNEQDVMAYHMGMTEVIDVEPIESSRGGRNE